MRVIQINTTCEKGSTGGICVAISSILDDENIENKILYSLNESNYPNGIKYSNKKYIKLQALKSRILGNYGLNSARSTWRLINEIEKINPDIVHIHNIHSHDCNFEILFSYLKEKKTKIIWTFHDCWAFTAYCPYFTAARCEKWRSQCSDCPQYKVYSWFFDRSETLFERKKKALSGLDLTIVTPSEWLADLTRQSFLGNYPVKVINNGIEIGVFKPTEGDFKEKYNIGDKKIVLGVALGWDERKGLDVLVELAGRLGDEYQVVLVGTNDKIDENLPDNIISIHRTHNREELAEIYTVADVFVNPTCEENYPTVNMEAISCGTPVITFRTGGSPEILDDSCGVVVECGDIDAMEREVIRVCTEKPFSKEACLEKVEEFNADERFKEYVKLYREINDSATKKRV